MTRKLSALIKALAILVAIAGLAAPAAAQDIRFFQIGTGSISGNYFPIGGLIASAISHPPGASLCGQGGSCGVPGLVAVAQASRGSVVNARNIGAGKIDSALVQADVAYFAVRGMGPFAGDKAVPGLRAIANLYPEAVHVVVRKGSPIRSIRDLAGKRVSLDLRGSGTRAIARLVLKGYGVDLKSVSQLNSQIGPAVDRLSAGHIDAFFFVGGLPVPSISRLAADVPLRLLPVRGEEASSIQKADPFLAPVHIPEGTYKGMSRTRTLAVGALWTVSDRASPELVYGITRALWHPTTRSILDQGPPATRQMRLENALNGIAIPLHDGAKRFYLEKGLLKAPAKSPPGKPGTAPKPQPGDKTDAPAAVPALPLGKATTKKPTDNPGAAKTNAP